jgi:hypothetical protein
MTERRLKADGILGNVNLARPHPGPLPRGEGENEDSWFCIRSVPPSAPPEECKRQAKVPPSPGAAGEASGNNNPLRRGEGGLGSILNTRLTTPLRFDCPSRFLIPNRFYET